MKYSPVKFPRLKFLAVSALLASSQLLQGAPTAASWSSSPDLPNDLVRATAVYFPANGRFYSMGGRTNDTLGSEMTTPYEYNPKTNTWAFKTAPFPDNQVCNMACGVLNAGRIPYIYCVGGTTGGGATTATPRVFRYDPIADKVETMGIDPWSEKAPNTVPGGFAVVQNKLYILGGLPIGSPASDRIFEFTPENPVGGQWTQKSATLPVGLSYIPTTAIGSLIFTAGGATFAPCDLTETTHSFVYDPAKDAVSLIPSIPRAAAETHAVTVGHEMWVLGGGRQAPNPSWVVNIYDSLTGEWRTGPALNGAVRNFAAASDGTNVLIAGGYNPAIVPMKATQIYRHSAR
jgi:hypothetical protein